MRVASFRVGAVCVAMVMSVMSGVAGAEPATPVATPTPGAILAELLRFRETGRVLYLAAHPDDENTRLIAYLANGRHYATAYLSHTRGDGGQNLIGPELGDELGLIRTHELILARAIDGGRQYFSRANDFGFSKSAEETLRVWDRRQVLADTVRVIRQFRPHVIVARFSPVPGGTHGHHTASTQLAIEAFDLAGDAAALADEVGDSPPWQPTRLVWNAWRPGGLPEAAADPTLLVMEVGGYDVLRGESYGEIAARSRSAHRSQGFGAVGTRGSAREFFALLAGEPARHDLMEDVPSVWADHAGGEEVVRRVTQVIETYDAFNPGAAVPALLQVRLALAALSAEDPVLAEKRAQLDGILLACLGLHAEATTARAELVPGEAWEVRHTVIQRAAGAVPVRWVAVRDEATGQVTSLDVDLALNQAAHHQESRALPAEAPVSHPYWLEQPGDTGMFRVDAPALIGTPLSPPVAAVSYLITVGGQELVLRVTPEEVFRDPVFGEIRTPLRVIPPVAVAYADELSLFAPGETREVAATVTAARAGVTGELRPVLPAGWHAVPASVPFALAEAGAQSHVSFALTAPPRAETANLGLVAEVGGRAYDRARRVIRYEHIPTLVLHPPARLRATSLTVATRGARVGYLPGAGDAGPEALGRLGYAVQLLAPADLTPAGLAGLDAVVLGIRSFNTQADLMARRAALADYAAAGGVVIVQYLTTAQLPPGDFGPYPLRISRDRVTDETAAVTLLAPEHPALRSPNRLTAADFDGWVQERGLYFANPWDAAYVPLLGMADPGEPMTRGSLLVARHGEGWYVYTGLSLFRQLPAGVPGAYRLLANLVSLGSHDDE
jgi:LmbE family N-acetylglucosaminyl deacetylase